MTKAVIFDMDGVLTDSEALICKAAISLFKKWGAEASPEDFTPYIGTGEELYIGEPAKKHGLDINPKEAKAHLYEEYLKLVPTELESFPGVSELINDLKSKGVKIAVATSADEIKMVANLEKIGHPRASWDACAYGDIVENKKPHPDIFIKAADMLGVAPEDCAVIEDSYHGVEAANRAGCLSIAVGHTFPQDRLRDAEVYVERIELLDFKKLRITNYD